MKRIILAIVSVFSVATLFPQGVGFTCAKVDERGCVFLGWHYAMEQDGFFSCTVERQLDENYDTVAIFQNLGTTSFVDTSGVAGSVVVKYRITATYDNNISYSDSIQTVLLNVVNNSGNLVLAFLSWNNPFVGSLEGGSYTVLRKIKNKTDWHPVVTTSALFYQDTVKQSVCHDTVMYTVFAIAGHDTLVSSKSKGSLFVDPLPTTPCKLDVVTVDEPTQMIHLSWEPSPDNDIWGYFICQGNPCMALDTIYGKYNTSYVAENHECTSVHDYRIYAFDSCFTASALTDYYHNIVLKGEAVDCKNEVSISWNEYINMPDGLGYYRIYVRYDNSSAFRHLHLVEVGQPLQHNFVVPTNVADVYVKVVAVGKNSEYVSESNILHVNMFVPDTAKFVYIRYASVNEKNKNIDLLFYVDSAFVADSYQLYRKTYGRGYTLYDNIPYTGESLLSYTDSNVDVENVRYTYCLAVKDACGGSEKRSNEASPVFVKLKTKDNVNYVSRTDYVGWDSVEYYYVCRRRETESEWETIGRMWPWEGSFADDISEIPSLRERLFYKVVAYQASVGDYIFQDSSHSQHVVYSRKGDLWVPNTIIPSMPGNDVFKPSSTFMRADGYLLQIYDRSGLLVYSTKDIDEGWDATSKGEPVPMGTYVYIIFCTFSDGTNDVFKGTVTVLK
ncbi:MAG: gliding motility-associated C-terminal domain-containing protein [Bacteroidales bacterium]|nr:gliding motility-associated C-terminal domain-containing protein [Bacteroidales bacterium]